MKRRIKLGMILLLICGNLYLGTKVILNGNQIEKTNLLSEAIWKLSEEGYTKGNIDNIDVIYNPIKFLNHPYRIEVKPKGRDAFYLVWIRDKSGVVRLEDS